MVPTHLIDLALDDFFNEASESSPRLTESGFPSAEPLERVYKHPVDSERTNSSRGNVRGAVQLGGVGLRRIGSFGRQGATASKR